MPQDSSYMPRFGAGFSCKLMPGRSREQFTLAFLNPSPAEIPRRAGFRRTKHFTNEISRSNLTRSDHSRHNRPRSVKQNGPEINLTSKSWSVISSLN